MVKSKQSLQNPLFLTALSMVLLTVLILTSLGSASAASFSDTGFEKIWQ